MEVSGNLEYKVEGEVIKVGGSKQLQTKFYG